MTASPRTPNHAVERTATRRAFTFRVIRRFTAGRARSRWPSLTLFSLGVQIAFRRRHIHEADTYSSRYSGDYRASCRQRLALVVAEAIPVPRRCLPLPAPPHRQLRLRRLRHQRRAQAAPTRSLASKEAGALAPKLLIKGSFNEVYVYWGDVAVRREPFTVTTTDEHSHIMLPEDYQWTLNSTDMTTLFGATVGIWSDRSSEMACGGTNSKCDDHPATSMPNHAMERTADRCRVPLLR